MDASTYFDRQTQRQKMLHLIKELVAQPSDTNFRDKILAVLLSGQTVKFLDDVDLLTALLHENNRLVSENTRLLGKVFACLSEHDAAGDFDRCIPAKVNAQMDLRFNG